MWVLSTNKLIKVSEQHSDPVLSISISPVGKLIASYSKGKTVRIWDLESGESRIISDEKIKPIYSINIVFSPDKKYIVVAINSYIKIISVR